LRYITNLNPVPATIDSDVFGGVDKSVCELKVPSSSVADYQAADVWKEFYNIIGINEEYTVTLTADNGTVTGDGVYPAGVNATVTAIPNTGYGFVNWTVEGTPISSSNPFVFEVTSDTLIHANFEAIAYNIAYELNGGTNHADNPVTYTIESPLITLQVPTHEGYTFTDWTEGDTIAAGSVGNKTFTAQWSSPIVYDITYELNGGTNPDGNPAEYTVEDAITLQDPTLTGYDFTGWLPDGKITVGSTGDRTFTAQWSPTVYGITYVLDGGDNHVDNPDSYTIKSSVTLKDPVREGFVFESWAEGNEIEQGSMGDKTFTALWKCTEANIEEIIINGTATAEISAVNDSVFEYTAQECDETSISLDLGASSQATVTINGDTYAPGTEIVFDEGDLTTVKIEVKPETGDNDKTYTLKIAAPITNNSLYYQRWDDVIAINQNPATNGGYDVSEIRWHKPDGTVDNSEFISISSVENSDNYYAEVKTVETDVWHHVCATIETKTSEKITAYPNPVSHGEKVTVNLPTSYVNGALNIYDIRGGLVKSELPLPTKVNSIDMSEFVPGIYLLRITDKKGNSKTVKIIKN
jgi:uncharacterized repeat protein (TIGR02543 family)